MIHPRTATLPRRGLLALAPLLAARCAALPTEPCSFAAPNPVPVAIAGNLPFVPMTVNGWPVTALLDTGAERTLVAETLLPALGLPQDPRRRAFQTGATGRTAARPLAQLRRVRLGSFEIANHMVAVIDRPGMNGPDGNPPQLVLGGDILAQHDLDIDLPAQRLTLHPARRCRLDAPPLPGRHYELPMRISRNHIVTDIEANGIPTDCILDTGANLVFISRERARSLGIGDAELAGAPQRGVRGINNETQNLSLARLRTLRIGPELHRDVPVFVGDGAPADLVIGMPWMGQRRIFVSYANLRLFVMVPPHRDTPPAA